MEWADVGRVLLNTSVLVLNGFLILLYGLWAHLPADLVWPLALGVVILLDRHV
jgi:hypothetical protein